MKEVEKYIPLISEKSGVPEDEILSALRLLPIKTYQRDYYKKQVRKAGKIMGKVDKKDADILGLSFHENCLLWSEDRHFRDNESVRLIRTKDLI